MRFTVAGDLGATGLLVVVVVPEQGGTGGLGAGCGAGVEFTGERHSGGQQSLKACPLHEVGMLMIKLWMFS
ncbi:hypothetical protein SRHO_G00345020 [Serrasalmus rhombeus]